MYLSDSPGNPRKWEIPVGSVIEAGGYLLVWADEDGTTGLEYALLLALVSMSSLVAWQSMGQTVANSADGSVMEMQPATTATGLNSGTAAQPMP